jgi:hypothetical protein
MNPKQDTEFRLKLAAGFLREAEGGRSPFPLALLRG